MWIVRVVDVIIRGARFFLNDSEDIFGFLVMGCVISEVTVNRTKEESVCLVCSATSNKSNVRLC